MPYQEQGGIFVSIQLFALLTEIAYVIDTQIFVKNEWIFAVGKSVCYKMHADSQFNSC